MTKDSDAKIAFGERKAPEVRSPAEKRPYKHRLPRIPNDELLGRVLPLIPEFHGFKTWAVTMQAPARYGENLAFMTVPELFAANVKYYTQLVALVCDVDPSLPPEEIWPQAVNNPDKPGYHRWRVMHTWLFHKHLDNGFARTISGVMAELAGFTPAMIQEIGFPDSDIWTDDERLCLKFAKATMNFEMTDELWDACVKAWGVKWILCMRELLNYYYGCGMLFDMVGLDRVEGLSRDKSVTRQAGGSEWISKE